MKTLRWFCGLTLLGLAACDAVETPTSPELASPQFARGGATQANIQINVLLDRPATDAIVAELEAYGRVSDRIDAIHAVMIRGRAEDVPAIQALPFVLAANPDAERGAGPPLPPVALDDFTGGLSTWNLDAVNVTDFGFANRVPTEDGAGVYIGVLDTGLLDTWRYYFPDERIAEEYARAFTGGPLSPTTASQPNKWEHDTQSHGTHVTSTILGYSLDGTPINGVAPMATVIPVKVLNNNGSGWSSTIAHGIVYIADLKAGPLSGSPVVVNMSLGGSALDAVEKAAIDYAIAQGVIIVASAGNRGEAGMGYPGGYEPVISVGSVGWAGQWVAGNWWWAINVSEPTNPEHFYVSDFSSREHSGQDLDVLAPGSWIVGPYQVNRGQSSYFFLGGTSMASPHVAGIVALMAQKNAGLTAAQAESILESTAAQLKPGSLNVLTPTGAVEQFTWGADATGSGLVSATAALAATP